MSQTEQYGVHSAEQLRGEFDLIDAPTFAKQNAATSISSKIIRQTVYAEYNANVDEDVIIQYYDSRLAANGWSKVSQIERSIKFCKGNMDAVIELTSTGSFGAQYYFGITRQSTPAEKSGCIK